MGPRFGKGNGAFFFTIAKKIIHRIFHRDAEKYQWLLYAKSWLGNVPDSR
jgi:hypothetical protein